MIAGAVLAAPAQAAPGDLDPSFGVGGKVTTNFGFVGPFLLFDSARAVAVQPDGKIVATGDSGNGSDFSDFALARYNTDGSLDTTFGGDGTVATRVAEQWDQAHGLALQSDGKIVLAGWAGPENIPFTDFALARYNADGSLDATFGGDGKVTSDLDEEVFFDGHDGAFAVAIQPDGKIVAAGLADLFNPAVGILARYNADGSLDASFGMGGKVTAPFPISSVVVQADGQIVAAGATFVDFALARYNADGSLDATFGGTGTVTTDFGGGQDGASSAAIQADGKIVLAGSAGGDVALARYNDDGNLDSTFGSGGKVTTDFGGQDGAAGVEIQTNGKLVVAGSLGSQFGLARYHMNGSLDSTFGSSGMVTTQFVGGSDAASDLAIQADGKIVAAGTANLPSDFALARYLGDPPVTQVSIDVQPRSKKNRVRLTGRSVIPVAILTTDTFDATTVDPATVCFGDAETPSERDCTDARGGGRIKDANRDDRPDVLLHYEVRETGIDAGDTSACLTGRTFTGLSIEGCDSIRTLPKTPADSGSFVVKGDFEQPVVAGLWVPVYPPGFVAWTVDSGSVDIVRDLWTAASGEQSIDLNGNCCAPGSISQDLPTKPGVTYALRFSFAGNPDPNPICSRTSPRIKQMEVFWGGTSVGVFRIDIAGHTLADPGWQRISLSVTASASTTTLRFTSLIPGACGPAVDDVEVRAGVAHV